MPRSAKFAEKPSSIADTAKAASEHNNLTKSPLPTGGSVAMAHEPSVVLDTNVLLDAWVFVDPGVTALLAALKSSQLRWLATAAMRDELLHTLAKPSLAAWQPDTVLVLGHFDRLAHVVDTPPASLAPTLLCRDPNDQMFIDLALAQQARWLLTHDRALLALARKSRSRGLAVLRPADWRLN